MTEESRKRLDEKAVEEMTAWVVNTSGRPSEELIGWVAVGFFKDGTSRTFTCLEIVNRPASLSAEVPGKPEG